jgi:hypothetical protein
LHRPDPTNPPARDPSNHPAVPRIVRASISARSRRPSGGAVLEEHAGTTTLVSTNAAGTDSANGHSANDRPAFVSENRIAFQSVGSDFGSTDTNNEDDIYLGTFG